MAADTPSGFRSGDRFVELHTVPGVAAVRWSADRRRTPRVRRSEALIGSKALGMLDHLAVELITVAPGRLQELAADDDVEFASPVYRLREDRAPVVFHSRRVAAHYAPDPGAGEVERRARRLRAAVLSAGALGPGSYLLEAAATDGPYGTLSLALRMVDEEGAAFASPDIVHEVGPRRSVLAGRGSRDGTTARSLDLWHLELAKVRDAWRHHGFQGHGVTVAVIDDGVDVDHIEFNTTGKVVGQRDFEENTTDARPKTAEDTHGTSCAGVAVARGVQVSGSAPAAGLLAVRLDFAMSSVDEAAMFLWAGDRADVISCSWGPDQPYFPPDVVLQALREVNTRKRGGKGVPIIFAAGNEAEDMSTDGYAASPYTIAVAASTDEDTVAPYSDFGADVDLCAPSSGGRRGVATTDRSGTAGEEPGDYRTDFGGTSSAAPLVAGVAALLLDAHPELTATEVRTILCATAEKIGDESFYDANGHSVDFGYGRLDADAAVAEARSMAQGTPGRGRRMSIRPNQPQARTTGPAPVFELDLAGNGVYSVEVATDPALFDERGSGDRRNADNFFSSYQAEGLLTATPYRLPDAVWRRLGKGPRLHYRAMSGRSASDPSDFRVTTPDDTATDAPFITVLGTATPDGSGPAVREVVYPSGARFAVVEEDAVGDEYADPAGDGVVPLIDTTGRLGERMSPDFVLGEFVGKVADRFRYARVSVELVRVLQEMRDRAGAAITLASSYRPPEYNTSVDGAQRSQHMAGRAADLKVGGLTPLQAAELALEVTGGDIGLGLGPTTVHVDLRGEPASWVYEGAVMEGAAFDQWVAARRRTRGTRRLPREVTDRRAPSVLAPTWAAVDAPPAFVIRPGTNRWVAVDVVTDPALFAPGAAGRTTENAYGSWEDGLVEALGPEVVVRVPADRWQALAKADRLFFRALATSADTDAWPDLASSLPDSDRADAPVIEVTAERGPRQRRLVVPPE